MDKNKSLENNIKEKYNKLKNGKKNKNIGIVESL